MASQLDVYNEALLVCGERFLASLTEEREPRRLLDHVWARGGVQFCLEKGQWNFAMRTIEIDYDPSVEPGFGYNRAFSKPADWVRTSGLCSDEFFRTPLTRYHDEANYWYSDLDTLFVRYVSSDPLYGLNMNKWPATFLEYVGAHFAAKIILKLKTSEGEVERAEKHEKNKLTEARSSVAQAEPTSFPAQGAWSRSRNRFPNRRDGGGQSGNLIG